MYKLSKYEGYFSADGVLTQNHSIKIKKFNK